ncbi:Mechanosensory protein 3 [Bienertia sinuspersici]
MMESVIFTCISSYRGHAIVVVGKGKVGLTFLSARCIISMYPVLKKCFWRVGRMNT